MSEPIARPVFFEGQILAAADLETVVEHARGESARDRRYLHTPGIATGLALKGRERQTAAGTKYQEVTLSAGMAIDRTGRQIVLPADTRLDETLFDELRVQVSDADAWYPVFVRGMDVQAPVQPAVAGSCGTTGAARVTESAEVTFGRPGQELETGDGEPPEVTDGPGNPSTLVLIGFVQWDRTITRFKKVALEVDGLGPSYAGALADEVVARAGALSLLAGEGVDKPALVLDQAEGGSLVFGLQDASGHVIPALTVDAKGNITTQGKILSAAVPGTVQVQSGVATDGVILPLPPGITQKQVDDEQVVLHVHLTPRPPGGAPPSLPPPSGVAWAAIPLECRMDAPSRRVLCLNRWIQLSSASLSQFEDHPGACDYTVFATVPPNTGSQS